MSAGALAAAAFSLGAALILVFDSAVPRAAGLILLFAGLGAGAYAIATPAFLARDDEGSAAPADPAARDATD
jgi:hypothetical protein